MEKTHTVIWFQLQNLSFRVRPQRFQVKIWKDTDWNKASFLLSFLPDGSLRDWASELWKFDSAQAASVHFFDHLRKIINICVPSKLCKHRSSTSAPWFSGLLLRLIKRRNRAYVKNKLSPSPSQFQKFKNLKRLVKKEVLVAKRAFFLDTFGKVSSTGDFWKASHAVTGQRPKPLPALSLPDGSIVSQDADKVSVLNKEFAYNFNSAGCCAPELQKNVPLDAEFLCPGDFILNWLCRLSPSMSTGLDLIPAQFLCGCASDLIFPVRCLLNRCLLEGMFPAEWKRAQIVPIPKVASPSIPSELRPISILPGLSKLAESWLLLCLGPYIIPADNQFAFWRGRSTEDALAFVQSTASKAMEFCVSKRKPVKVAVVSFDIVKAFDQICHLKLIQILEKRGVPPGLLRILASYLSNRMQQVSISGISSDPVACSSGVPQGSVMGGPLFNVYIDSVLQLNLTTGSTLAGYADDLILVKAILDETAEQCLQLDINMVVDCYSELLLKVQSAKTKLLVCSIAPRPLKSISRLVVHGNAIAEVSTLKYLGVVLDRKLDFGENARSLAARSRRILGALKASCKPLLGLKAFAHIYMAKILPILTYSIAVTAPAKKGPFSLLEKSHRLVARIVLNDWTSSYNSLLRLLNWRSISQICFERRCLLIWKYVNSVRHLPAGVICRKSSTECSKRLRNAPHQLDIEILRSKKSAIDELPFLNCLHTWNTLSSYARSASFSFARLAIRNHNNYTCVQRQIPSRLILIDDF